MKYYYIYIIMLLFISCKTQRVTQEVPVELHNSTTEQNDRVIERLTEKLVQNNCTIYLDTTGRVVKEIYLNTIIEKDILHDTIQTVITDTTEIPVEITKTVEVKNPIKDYAIGALITLLIGMVLLLFGNKKT